jgi:hypothetical protein
MSSCVHHSLRDYLDEVGSLEGRLVEVALLCVLMLNHLVIMVTQRVKVL